MNPSVISVLSAMAAAVWSVWTWQSEREKAREVHRDAMSAQYVNNLILATQELQRKIFKILEEDELAHYRLKYAQPVEPATPIAIDLLFHLSTFFGWEIITFRYGPYTRDSKMIAIMAQIGEMLESRSRFPGDAFRFTSSDRHALGQAVVRRVAETVSGPAFLTITRFKFEEEMKDKKGELAGLFRSDEVRCTLESIDRAVRGEPLEGSERLAVLQNLLLDLVSHLEREEGFRVAFGERGRATVANAEDVSPNGTDVKILHQMQGRIRLKVPRLHADRDYAPRLQSLLQRINDIKSVRVNVGAACVVVEYSADVSPAEFSQAVVAKVEEDINGPSHN